jgi:hypothetical protein
MRKLFCRPGDAAEIHATAELPSTQWLAGLPFLSDQKSMECHRTHATWCEPI